ncbi:MAG: iron-sulfur cluster repair di-iron protein [Planctomycetes bacterium]|nr:iron-sulfur cluster repair di-iron protein [Planctomycetota bacterium]
MPATTIDPAALVADIVTAHPECARVLKEHRIDFCCKGRQPLQEACAQGGQDLEAVLGDLEAALAARAGQTEAVDPRRLSVPALVALIIDRHHGWLREALPWIEAMAAKVARVHGEHDPRLADLGRLVANLRPLLLDHLDEEEQQLFPALMARNTAPEVVRDGLAAMEAEHRQVGALLERARALTDDFSPPEWACGTYRTLLAELEHLEDDVLRHVHLENHVLAVKARRAD